MELIVEETRKRKLNQRTLAEKAGVAPPVVNRIFKGGSANLKNFMALLDFLGFSVVRSGVNAPSKNVDSEILSLQKELTQSYKNLAEHKDRIRELEMALAALRLRHMTDRRREDPPEVNPAELRRPLEPGNAQNRH